MSNSVIQQHVKQVGKKVFNDLYIHNSQIHHLHPDESSTLLKSATNNFSENAVPLFNVLKINEKLRRVSFLYYENFDTDAFPVLADAWTYNEVANETAYRSYRTSRNPPILHRKELLVDASHPNYNDWAKLTANAERLGLFETPTTIGFKYNWYKLIHSKGYKLENNEFLPLGNDDSEAADFSEDLESANIKRHLTALNRVNLSAPVQLLIRNGLINTSSSVLDYGCGKGDDVVALRKLDISCTGWDPFYFPDNPLVAADVVNLGFVVNVIEEPDERQDVLHKAFRLANKVLAVSVMLYSSARVGRLYSDGIITTRRTFQKYFSQEELKRYLEELFNKNIFMIGPGVALIFTDTEVEQRFSYAKTLSPDGLRRRIFSFWRQPKGDRGVNVRQFIGPRNTSENYTLLKPHLERLWNLALELGRFPEIDEIEFFSELPDALQSVSKIKKLLEKHYDRAALLLAENNRADEIKIYLAAQHFEKRAPYTRLEKRIQRDIRYFFGNYKSAQSAALALLLQSAEVEAIYEACQEASTQGLGWLDGQHSLQMHISILSRLPAILRVYINCGLVLWDNLSEIQLIKVHVASGKLTLLEYDNFETSSIPLLRKRIKVNLRKLDYDLFEYGSQEYPQTPLYFKSRYMHEEMDGYAQQVEFDGHIESLMASLNENEHLSLETLRLQLDARRMTLSENGIMKSKNIPNLDQLCGKHFSYRNFIECGETQKRLHLSNIPSNPETYNALYSLATQVLDPVVDYFGLIRLTYGFCSNELSREISGRIAPTLDQHAGHELNVRGEPICSRLGAAVDFIVDDESMYEVAVWICKNTPFDRIYIYGEGKPLHVSFSETPRKQVTKMAPSANGRLIPRTFSLERFLASQE